MFGLPGLAPAILSFFGHHQQQTDFGCCPLQVGGAAACGVPVLAPERTAMFSSTSSVWSQAGAAHYSAGNAFLDATAAAAMAAGLPVTAVNFGPFRRAFLCGTQFVERT